MYYVKWILSIHNSMISFCFANLQCLKDAEFTKINGRENDSCIRNPRDCPDGFSLSFFYKQLDTGENYGDATKEYEREYLVSTGKSCQQRKMLTMNDKRKSSFRLLCAQVAMTTATPESAYGSKAPTLGRWCPPAT